MTSCFECTLFAFSLGSSAFEPEMNAMSSMTGSGRLYPQGNNHSLHSFSDVTKIWL